MCAQFRYCYDFKTTYSCVLAFHKDALRIGEIS